jgi:hypothetical protein
MGYVDNLIHFILFLTIIIAVIVAAVVVLGVVCYEILGVVLIDRCFAARNMMIFALE